AQAAAEGTARARSAPDGGAAVMAMFGEKGPVEIAVRPALAVATESVRPALLLLVGAVGLLLVCAMANAANLQLAHAATRQKELIGGVALGASRGRLFQQIIVESLVVSACGGVLALVLARIGVAALPWLLPLDFPRVEDIGIDARVFAYAAI